MHHFNYLILIVLYLIKPTIANTVIVIIPTIKTILIPVCGNFLSGDLVESLFVLGVPLLDVPLSLLSGSEIVISFIPGPFSVVSSSVTVFVLSLS